MKQLIHTLELIGADNAGVLDYVQKLNNPLIIADNNSIHIYIDNVPQTHLPIIYNDAIATLTGGINEQ